MRYWDRAFARSESLDGEWSSLVRSGFLLGTSGVLVGLDGSLGAGWSSVFWKSLDVEASGRIGYDVALDGAFGNWRGFAGAVRTACSVVPLFWSVWFGLTTGFGWLWGCTGVIWSTKLRLTSSRDEIWLWALANFPPAICECSSLSWRWFVASVSCFFSERHTSSSEFFIPTSFLRFRIARSFSTSCCFRSVIMTISRVVSFTFCAFSRACTILHSMLQNGWRTTSRLIELFSATLSAEPPSDTVLGLSLEKHVIACGGIWITCRVRIGGGGNWGLVGYHRLQQCGAHWSECNTIAFCVFSLLPTIRGCDLTLLTINESDFTLLTIIECQAAVLWLGLHDSNYIEPGGRSHHCFTVGVLITISQGICTFVVLNRWPVPQAWGERVSTVFECLCHFKCWFSMDRIVF